MRLYTILVGLALSLGCRAVDGGIPLPVGVVAPRRHHPTAEERFFDWGRMDFAAEVHASRRERLAEGMKGGAGVFLIPSHPGRSHGGTFRQNSDFMYFTGLELPQSMLAVDASGVSQLFVPERDARFESASRSNDFPGRKLGADPELASRSGLLLRPYGELVHALHAWVGAGAVFYLDLGGALGGVVPADYPVRDYVRESSQTAELCALLRARHPGVNVRNGFLHVAKLRMRKDKGELERLAQAAAITAAGIRTSARFIRPGVDERTLEAEMEAEFKRRGSQRLAFASIIKSGPNSLWPWRILAAHYDRRNRTMRAGELVIYDVGCELDGYVSDVGRTFPVSGRFSAEQRATLEMMTGVADTIMAAVRPGTTLLEIQEIAERAIPELERPYMQTGLYFGHHIGLDVGDPSLADEPLVPGMVFTIEPWYYDHVREIAVFVEDIVVVTESGCRNLTAGLPRTAEELEAMTGRDERAGAP